MLINAAKDESTRCQWRLCRLDDFKKVGALNIIIIIFSTDTIYASFQLNQNSRFGAKSVEVTLGKKRSHGQINRSFDSKNAKLLFLELKMQ